MERLKKFLNKKNRVVILSGYFNPIHCGHLDMIEAAAELGRVVVIVNNDQQQLLKKGRVIINQDDRVRMVKSLKLVDDVILSIDSDRTVSESIKVIAQKYCGFDLAFANGGDRNAIQDIPEGKICQDYNIELIFGVGGAIKYDSSTRINTELGLE